MQNFDSWQNYFDHPDGSFLGLLVALYTIGSLVSIPLVYVINIGHFLLANTLTSHDSPILADRFGRKLPIFIGCLFMIAGAVMQGTCKNVGVFAAGRVLLGFGNSLAQLCSPMLLTEICHPQHRGRLTTVYNCLWNVGALSGWR